MRRARVELVGVAVDTRDKSLVTLTYKVSVGDVSESDTQQLRRDGPVWCLVLKEKPSDTADKFRRLFRM